MQIKEGEVAMEKVGKTPVPLIAPTRENKDLGERT